MEKSEIPLSLTSGFWEETPARTRKLHTVSCTQWDKDKPLMSDSQLPVKHQSYSPPSPAVLYIRPIVPWTMLWMSTYTLSCNILVLETHMLESSRAQLLTQSFLTYHRTVTRECYSVHLQMNSQFSDSLGAVCLTRARPLGCPCY